MQISIFGSGYVGLVTAACFADIGHDVTCFDIDTVKINSLREGKIPIFEPGLEHVVTKNLAKERIRFTSSVNEATENQEIIFIAVGTPQNEDGSTNLSIIESAAKMIGDNLSNDVVICVKSTVPVGTTELVFNIIKDSLHKRKLSKKIDIGFNPEFLKEGDALNDFNNPDRVIIGANNKFARDQLTECYKPFNKIFNKLIYMDIRSAELTKYAANAMLASRISFMNEMSQISSRMGVDIENIRVGISLDPRIGKEFLNPGCGFGGSCFPKDIRSLIKQSEAVGYTPCMLNSIEQINQNQKKYLNSLVRTIFGSDFSGLVFAIWGLSFKPGTDDIREAPSIEVINFILSNGGILQLYDPEALTNIKKMYGDDKRIKYCSDKYEALLGAHALIIPTDWSEFSKINFKSFNERMSRKLIIDGRNIFNPDDLSKKGVEYYAVSRGISIPK